MARRAARAKRAKGGYRRRRYRGRRRRGGPSAPLDPMMTLYAIVGIVTFVVLAIPVAIFLPVIIIIGPTFFSTSSIKINTPDLHGREVNTFNENSQAWTNTERSLFQNTFSSITLETRDSCCTWDNTDPLQTLTTLYTMHDPINNPDVTSWQPYYHEVTLSRDMTFSTIYSEDFRLHLNYLGSMVYTSDWNAKFFKKYEYNCNCDTSGTNCDTCYRWYVLNEICIKLIITQNGYNYGSCFYNPNFWDQHEKEKYIVHYEGPIEDPPQNVAFDILVQVRSDEDPEYMMDLQTQSTGVFPTTDWATINAGWVELWVTIFILILLIIGFICCSACVVTCVVCFFIIQKKCKIFGIIQKKFKRVEALKDITSDYKKNSSVNYDLVENAYKNWSVSGEDDEKKRREKKEENFVVELSEEEKMEVTEDFEDEWDRIENKKKGIVTTKTPKVNVNVGVKEKGDVLQPQRNVRKQNIETYEKNEVPESNYMY